GSMQVDLDRAKTVCPSLQPLDQRGPEHISIEDVGALPVGNMHHAMVERDRNRHSCSLRPHPVIGSVPVVPGNPALGKNSIRRYQPTSTFGAQEATALTFPAAFFFSLALVMKL